MQYEAFPCLLNQQVFQSVERKATGLDFVFG